MNDLQKLLKLRGLSVARLAQDLGRGYHAVQKVVKGHHISPHIRREIAEHLGLHYYEIWGDAAQKTMRRLIREEINRRAAITRRQLRREYLERNGCRLSRVSGDGND